MVYNRITCNPPYIKKSSTISEQLFYHRPNWQCQKICQFYESALVISSKLLNYGLRFRYTARMQPDRIQTQKKQINYKRTIARQHRAECDLQTTVDHVNREREKSWSCMFCIFILIIIHCLGKGRNVYTVQASKILVLFNNKSLFFWYEF